MTANADTALREFLSKFRGLDDAMELVASSATTVGKIAANTNQGGKLWPSLPAGACKVHNLK